MTSDRAQASGLVGRFLGSWRLVITRQLDAWIHDPDAAPDSESPQLLDGVVFSVQDLEETIGKGPDDLRAGSSKNVSMN